MKRLLALLLFLGFSLFSLGCSEEVSPISFGRDLSCFLEGYLCYTSQNPEEYLGDPVEDILGVVGYGGEYVLFLYPHPATPYEVLILGATADEALDYSERAHRRAGHLMGLGEGECFVLYCSHLFVYALVPDADELKGLAEDLAA